MRLINVIVLFLVLLLSTEAFAQNCTLSMVSINFGSYDSFNSSPTVSTGSITVNCDSPLPFVIRLDPGQHSGGSFHPRKMSSLEGVSTLDYNLYRDASLNEVWGDGAGNTFVHTGVGIGDNQQFAVYGRIPARQNVRGGAYSDSVAVTVEW